MTPSKLAVRVARALSRTMMRHHAATGWGDFYICEDDMKNLETIVGRRNLKTSLRLAGFYHYHRFAAYGGFGPAEIKLQLPFAEIQAMIDEVN